VLLHADQRSAGTKPSTHMHTHARTCNHSDCLSWHIQARVQPRLLLLFPACNLACCFCSPRATSLAAFVPRVQPRLLLLFPACNLACCFCSPRATSLAAFVLRVQPRLLLLFSRVFFSRSRPRILPSASTALPKDCPGVTHIYTPHA
jgi:uncharacterized Fe-S radical SAM superfamily protein PflX